MGKNKMIYPVTGRYQKERRELARNQNGRTAPKKKTPPVALVR
jgi:hypothetical protein